MFNENTFKVMFCVWAGIAVAVMGAAGYIVCHFIAKIW